MKKKRGNKVKRLMLECDKLAKQIVFLRDKECVTCPIWEALKRDTDKPHQGSEVMSPGHGITRGSKSVRWDLRNVYQQCNTCNFMHENYPMPLFSYMIHKLGLEGFEQLMVEGHKPMPSIHVYDLEFIKSYLEAELTRYETS